MATGAAERQGGRGLVGSALVVLLWATAAAYVALWLGGALEVLTHEESPDGPGCYVDVPWEDSTAVLGSEENKWFGGGVFGRPGRVCVLEPSSLDRFAPEVVTPELASALAADGRATSPVFTELDMLSALAAVVVFGVVVVLGAVRALLRRRAERVSRVGPQSSTRT